MDPLKSDRIGLDKSEEERAAKIINDASGLGAPNFISPHDILMGNELLNVFLLAELFSRNNGLEPQQEYNKDEKRNFARIINEKLKDDKDLVDILPINPMDESLFLCLKDGIILK